MGGGAGCLSSAIARRWLGCADCSSSDGAGEYSAREAQHEPIALYNAMAAARRVVK
jgi:hypothetical protein